MKKSVKSVQECGTSKWLPVTLVIYGSIFLCYRLYNYDGGSRKRTFELIQKQCNIRSTGALQSLNGSQKNVRTEYAQESHSRHHCFKRTYLKYFFGEHLNCVLNKVFKNDRLYIGRIYNRLNSAYVEQVKLWRWAPIMYENTMSTS